VEADLEQAERLGIPVFTREDLETGLGRTLTGQDAQTGFRQAKDSIKTALAKYTRPREDG